MKEIKMHTKEFPKGFAIKEEDGLFTILYDLEMYEEYWSKDGRIFFGYRRRNNGTDGEGKASS
jgi:hypothetical protein